MPPWPPNVPKGGSVAADARWGLAALWRSSPRLSIGLVLVVLTRGLPPAGMAIVAKGLVDEAARGVVNGSNGLERLAPWLAGALVLMLVEALTPLASRYLAQRLQDELHLRFTVAVLERAGRLDPAFFEQRDGRRRLERAREGSSTAFAAFVQDLVSAASGSVQMVTLVAILASVEPLLLVVLPPVALPFLWVQFRQARRRYDEERSRVAKRRHARHLAEQLTGEHSLAEVRLLGLAPLLVRRFRDLLEGLLVRDRVHQARGFRATAAFGVLTALGFFALFARVALRAFAGTASLGQLAIFGGAAARLRYSLELTVASASGALERVLYLGDLRSFLELEPPERAGIDDGRPAVERIHLRALSYTFPGAERPAVDGVTFKIERGEIVALVGENGAGKTTVARLLSGVLEPTAGSVFLDEVDTRTLGVDAIARHVALLPQIPTRFEATAFDNVAFGDWRRLLTDRSEVERLARQLGLDDLIASLPDGWQTRLGRIESDHDLSAGQWLRVGFARVCAHGGSVLILDEPSAHLDPIAERDLFRRLRTVAEDRATLLISHRPTTVAFADRVVVLDSGRIVEQGTPAQLLARGGLYSQLFALGEREMAPPSP